MDVFCAELFCIRMNTCHCKAVAAIAATAAMAAMAAPIIFNKNKKTSSWVTRQNEGWKNGWVSGKREMGHGAETGIGKRYVQTQWRIDIT